MRDLMFSELTSEDPESKVHAVAFYDRLVTLNVPMSEEETSLHALAITEIEEVGSIIRELTPVESDHNLISNFGLADDHDAVYRGIPVYQMFIDEVLDGANVCDARLRLSERREEVLDPKRLSEQADVELAALTTLTLTLADAESPTTPVQSPEALNVRVARLTSELARAIQDQSERTRTVRDNVRTHQALLSTKKRGKQTPLGEFDAFVEWVVSRVITDKEDLPFGFHYCWTGTPKALIESVLWIQLQPALKLWISSGGPLQPTDLAAMKNCMKFLDYMYPAKSRAHYYKDNRPMTLLYVHGIDLVRAVRARLSAPVDLLEFLVPDDEVQAVRTRGRTIIRHRPGTLRHELVGS